MEKRVNVGIIGLGARAETLLATIFEMDRNEVLVTAICDIDPQRVIRIQEIMKNREYPEPMVFEDYKKLLESDQVDAVLVPTSWNSHLHIAEYAKKLGKYAGIEVGGASSLDELWH